MIDVQSFDVADAGVDWLSASSPERNLYDYANSLHWRTEYRRHWAMLGYAGFETEGVRAGINADGASFVQLSGQYARTNWRSYYQEAANCSRLDIQVTVKTKQYRGDIAERFGTRLHSYQTEVRAKRGPLKMPKPRLINGYGEGDTLYIGSRSSAQMCRIYDKEKESRKPEYLCCWRFEIEFHDELAKMMAATLIGSEHTEHLAVRLAVMAWLKNRGLYVTFHSGREGINLPNTYHKTELEEKLMWLEKQVRPTLQKLLVAGYGLSAINALDLETYLPELQEYVSI